DRCDAARARDRRDMGSINALGREVAAGQPGVVILAERADHRDPGTEAGGHDGLVGALAAESHRKPLAEDRLAGARHTGHVRDEIDVAAPDDDDVRHDRDCPIAGPALDAPRDRCLDSRHITNTGCERDEYPSTTETETR